MPQARFLLLCAMVLAGSSALAGSTGALAAKQPASRCSRTMHPGHGLQRFVASLRPGERGCLPPGSYHSTKLTFPRSGRPGAPITLRSSDAAHPAVIHGVVWLRNDANYVTLEDLVIVGTSGVLPTVIVNGDNSVWNRIDVSNPPADGEPGGICFSLGNTDGWGYAANTTIESSRIHDCGRSTNMNHGIYVQATSGRTLIRDNWIFRNGDRGIQFFPAAQNVLVSHNVIDGNGSGVIFSGDESHTSHDITVSDNIISNSTVRWNVESSFPAGVAVGTNNVVTHNCVWASGRERFYDARGGISGDSGFVSSGNVVQHPLFESSAAGDLRLKSPSGCRGYGLTGPSPPGPRGARVLQAAADRAHTR